MRFSKRVIASVAGVAFALPMIVAGPAAANNQLLEEIVVKARKIEESSQDVPISMTVISGDALEIRRVERIANLDDITPNLEISVGAAGPAGANISIRGQANRDNVMTSDNTVGIYLDGVVVPRASGVALGLYDVSRIEVLKGPQGTLYGRNTTGGAISIYTNEPELDAFDGRVTGTFGNSETAEISGFVNIPLVTDTLGLRIAAKAAYRDGFGTNQAPVAVGGGNDQNDDNTESFRASILWMPSQRTSVKLVSDYTDMQRTGAPSVLTAATGADFFNGGAATLGPVGASLAIRDPAVLGQIGGLIAGNPVLLGAGFGQLGCIFIPGMGRHPDCVAISNIGASFLNSAFVGSADIQDGASNNLNGLFNNGETGMYGDGSYFGLGLTIEHDFDAFTLRSITGYRDGENVLSTDIDGTFLSLLHPNAVQESESFTQEINLLGDAFEQRLDWLVGAYYFDEEGTEQSSTEFLGIAGLPVSIGPIAEVGNESRAVFVQGTWHFNESWSTTIGARYTEDDRSFAVAGSPESFLSEDWSNASYAVGVEYKPNDDLLLYLKRSTGYRAGGYDFRGTIAGNAADPTFDEEAVGDWEIGIKADLLDNLLRLNLSVFDSDYKDQQLSTLGANRTGVGLATIIDNAGQSSITGAELEATYAPTDNLTLLLSGGWIDADITEFNETQADGSVLDRSNEPMVFTPEFTYSVGANYVHPLSNGELNFYFNYGWRDDVHQGRGYLDVAEDRGLLDARVTFTPSSDRYSVSLWGYNLTDEDYFDRVLDLQATFGLTAAHAGAPMTYGIDLTFNFQ